MTLRLSIRLTGEPMTSVSMGGGRFGERFDRYKNGRDMGGHKVEQGSLF